jgi:hypothetical protein
MAGERTASGQVARRAAPGGSALRRGGLAYRGEERAAFSAARGGLPGDDDAERGAEQGGLPHVRISNTIRVDPPDPEGYRTQSAG